MISASPVTKYDQLGPDKRSIQTSTNSTQHTVAGLESVKLLSRLWGDEVDNTSDSTSEPVTDSDNFDSAALHPVALQYLANNMAPDAGHPFISNRKSKKHKSPKNSTKAGSERVVTRSKKTNNLNPST
jgi:hypothetical protein